MKKDDLLYLGPTYSNTETLYNDNCTESNDKLLMKAVNKEVDRDVQFVMSYVFSHNGKTNKALRQWVEKYDNEHVKNHTTILQRIIESYKFLVLVKNTIKIL